MKLYAWIGEDEFGGGTVGLKQARVPAGFIPLVSLDRSKIDRVEIRRQLAAQAAQFGVTIRLVSFTLDDADALVVLPGGS